MSLISFMKEAGEKLFGRKHEGGAGSTPAPAAPTESPEELNKKAGQAIMAYVRTQGLTAKALDITFDGATSTVSVYGVAPDQATREKIIIASGNVAGVEKVNDRMEVDNASPAGTYYTVVKGDTLSKIAKSSYGDANAYMGIFNANKPMLSDPDKIYPGQVLRIPPKGAN